MEIFKIISTSMIIAVTSFVVGLLGFYLRTRIYDTKLKILKPPKVILFISVGVVLSIATAMFCSILFSPFPESIFAIFGFPFLLSSAWLIPYSINWRIEIEQDGFIFKNSFGKKFEFKYDEINKVRRLKNGGFRIFLKKKLLLLIVTSKELIIYGIY